MPTNPDQPDLGLTQPAGATTAVDTYEFEPIQGYPMLNWRGKRPFRSTQYYPAQPKEQHGAAVDGPDGRPWRNRIYWGDNLQVMSHLRRPCQPRSKVSCNLFLTLALRRLALSA